MRRSQRGSVWLYLVLLAGLFALSVAAPRVWDHDPRLRVEALLAAHRSAFRTAAKPRSAAITPRLARSIQPANPAFVNAPPAPEAGAELIEAFDRIAKPWDNRLQEVLLLPEVAAPSADVMADPRLAAPLAAPEPVRSSRWPAPQTLLTRLERLSLEPESRHWAASVQKLILELTAEPAPGRQHTVAVIGRMRAMAAEGELLPGRIRSAPLATELRRTNYELTRRLELWSSLVAMGRLPGENGMLRAAAHPPIEPQLTEALAMINPGPSGNGWREYLLLGALQGVGSGGDDARHGRAQLAQRVLNRMQANNLTDEQRQFVSTAPMAELASRLRTWASEPVDVQRLLEDLERYELTGLPSDARALSRDRLALAATGSQLTITQRLETHYRNANLRIAVSGEFINRFLPQNNCQRDSVVDTVVGVPVRGCSTTNTCVSAHLIPDPQRFRIGLEARGNVDSQTSSTTRGVTFRNQGESSYVVRKEIVVGPDGIQSEATTSSANSRNDLDSVETDYDGVPILGTLVRNYARSEHEASRAQARREVEAKVSSRARCRFDAEIAPRLAKAEASFREKVIAPLDRLSLEPTAMSMETTTERLCLRARLAGTDQLGAHTARPQAPAGSLLSLQMHQSAMNNAIEQLGLNGRSFTLPELYQWIGTKLDREVKLPEDLPDDVIITFADRDAIAVRCLGGELELTISIAKLKQQRRAWRDFQVQTTYVPQPGRLDLRFVRASTIELLGEDYEGRPEIALRGIFSKVLSRERPLVLSRESWETDARLRDVRITQCVIEDGWIGIALGPQPAGVGAPLQAQSQGHTPR